MSLQFEYMMTLWTYGNSLINNGHFLLQTVENSDREASNSFLVAGGVFEHLFSEITIWQTVGINVKEIGLPESFPSAAALMSKCCIALNNMVAIKTAAALKKKNSVIARLCIAVYQLFDKMKLDFDVLAKESQDTFGSQLNLSLKEYISFNRVLYRSLTCMFMGLDAKDVGKDGLVFLFKTMGLNQIDQFVIHEELERGLCADITLAKKAIHKQLSALEALDEHFDVEFKTLLPEGVTIMKCVPFALKPSFLVI
jgi:hypothetical protein